MLSPEIITELSDEDIVVRTLHDRSYFEVIVERFEDKLTRYLRRLGVHIHEDRQDLIQDIFIKVYKNLYGFDKNLSFSSLYVVLRLQMRNNTCCFIVYFL